jgi:hypothetical protein
VSVKDLVKDVAGGAAEVAIGLVDPTGVGAKVLSITLGRIGEAEARRARALYASMKDPNVSDDDFVAEINRRLLAEPEVLAVFRSLLVASVESVTLDALAAMGRVGRRYLCGECPQWVARGIVRLLAELSDAELGALRETVARHAAAPHHSGWLHLGVTFGGSNSEPMFRRHTGGNSEHTAKGHALRLESLLQQYGLTASIYYGQNGVERSQTDSVNLSPEVVAELVHALVPVAQPC